MVLSYPENGLKPLFHLSYTAYSKARFLPKEWKQSKRQNKSEE